MLHGSFKFGGKYHTTSKLGRESTERPGDGFFFHQRKFSQESCWLRSFCRSHQSSRICQGKWYLIHLIINMNKLQEDSPLPSSSTLLSGVAVIGGETFLRNGTSVSKTWQQHQRNTASVSSQRCLRITPAVGMLHIVTLWTHPDTWVMLGFKSIFWTQISSKSKTKKRPPKRNLATSDGNKIKEASVSGGNC